MIKIKDIGDFESVPAIVNDILQGNTEALDEHLSKGFDIEEDIKLGKYTRLSPLGLALNKCQLCSVLYFVYKYSL